MQFSTIWYCACCYVGRLVNQGHVVYDTIRRQTTIETPPPQPRMCHEPRSGCMWPADFLLFETCNEQGRPDAKPSICSTYYPKPNRRRSHEPTPTSSEILGAPGEGIRHLQRGEHGNVGHGEDRSRAVHVGDARQSAGRRHHDRQGREGAGTYAEFVVDFAERVTGTLISGSIRCDGVVFYLTSRW